MNIGDTPEQLEEAVLTIFDAINVPENIEAIHRLPTKAGIKPTIMCLDNRKLIRSIHENKHKLHDLKALNLQLNGLTNESKIYINPSLTQYSKCLSYNCRILRRKGLVDKIKIEDTGEIKIRMKGEVKFVRIRVESDLTTYFPFFKEFNFDGA